MNWTRDVKEVFLTALDKLEGDRMTRGANAGDLYTFFAEVKRLHALEGRLVHFKLHKQCGCIDGVAFNDFNVKCGLLKILDVGGSYLLFGKSKRSSDLYKKFLTTMSKVGDDVVKLEKWSKIADGKRPKDHAIGIKISNTGVKTLFDNGFTTGSKEFSMYNIADRMCDVSMCYAIDLWEECL